MAHFRVVVKALANAIDDASRCSMAHFHMIVKGEYSTDTISLRCSTAHFHMVVKDVRSIVLGCSTPE